MIKPNKPNIPAAIAVLLLPIALLSLVATIVLSFQYSSEEDRAYDAIYAEQEADYTSNPANRDASDAERQAVVTSMADNQAESDPRMPRPIKMLVPFAVAFLASLIGLPCCVIGFDRNAPKVTALASA